MPTSLRDNVLAGLHWKPDRHTAFAVLTYALVVATFVVAFQLITKDRVAANFAAFAFGLVGLGIAVPVFWTIVVRRQPLSEIGITTRYLVPSLVLSAIMGADAYSNTISQLNVTWSSAQASLATMALAVVLFETVFFRGWLQLRFEDAFGIIPGVVLGALCYAFYHIGYGMNLAEMMFLFGYGIVWGSIFRLTKNIFVLWPLYTPVGSLYTTLKEGLQIPFEATYSFVLLIVVTASVVAAGHYWRSRHADRREAVAAVPTRR
jgi:membrane protease YdiL (CAAX protease family)